jgi:formate hydrogenlyase subunit 4
MELEIELLDYVIEIDLWDIARKLLQAGCIVAVPPILLGLVNKTKALFGGRVGPPLLQPYYDIAKLLRKDSVFSRTTTWVFRAGPVIGLVTALLAAALVPIGPGDAILAFDGDFLVLAYLLGLSRFFTMAAALDTGSAFEGMGAAREATFACLAEPAFIIGLLGVARATGSISLSGFFGPEVASVWFKSGPTFVLVAAGLFVVMLAENCRVPVDDPNTHLELTMIHEVMVLDHGGPALGFILYGAAVKLFVFAAMLTRLILPFGHPAWAVWLALAGGLAAISIAIGIVESVMARLRLTHVPAFLLAACMLCALGVVLLVR